MDAVGRRRFAFPVAAWVACMVVAALLSVLAAMADRWPGDRVTLEWVQDWPGWLEPVADGIRAVTGTQVVLTTGSAACVGLWLAGRRGAAVGLAVALIALPFLQSGIKDVVDRPRPNPAIAEYRGSAGSPSFPSGHVMSGTVLYGWLAFVALREARPALSAAGALAMLFVLANGVANVYAGVHWPSDVLGGYAWAAVLLVTAAIVEEITGGPLKRGPARG